MQLRKTASDARRRFRNSLFGNNHSTRINLRYASYHRKAQRAWQPMRSATQEEQAIAQRFQSAGYEVLPPPPTKSPEELLALKAKIDRLFADPAGVCKISDGLSRMIDGLDRVPEITEFIDPALEAIIESYYQSHFKIFGVYFYHTEPVATKPQSSFLWHADNCPRQEIKLMIYLDDVTADTGAIRLKTKAQSDSLKSRGFIERGRYEMFRAELDDPTTTNAVEGGIGTRILFENGGAIHKAVLPQREHRDVVTFVIIPSDVHWRAQFARNKHLLSTNTGICIDPATDAPESVGYRN